MSRKVTRRRDGISIENKWKHRKTKTGKQWLAKVWDRRVGRYKSRAWFKEDEAIAWAKQTRRSIDLQEATAGTWKTSEVAEECTEYMAKEGRNPAYIQAIKRHALMLEKVGIVNLADDNIKARIRDYLALPTEDGHRRTESAAPAGSTVRTRIIYLRSLVSYARKHMSLPINPLVGLVMPAAAKKAAAGGMADQEVYTLAEIRSVLALKEEDNPVWLAFVLAVYAGLRASELHALRWENLDWESRVLRVVKGKGGKVRVVAMQPDLADLLHRLGGPGATKPRNGTIAAPLKSSGFNVHWHLRPLLERAGVTWDRGICPTRKLPRRLTWHACRRTCAAASLAAGVDSLDLQRSLGHADISLTGDYAGAFTTWKRLIENEGWPRGRLWFFPRASGGQEVKPK